MNSQKCVSCGFVKPLVEFTKYKGRDTHRKICRPCDNRRNKEYKEKRNPKPKDGFFFDPLLQGFVDRYANGANLSVWKVVMGYPACKVVYNYEEEMEMEWIKIKSMWIHPRYGNPMIVNRGALKNQE